MKTITRDGDRMVSSRLCTHILEGRIDEPKRCTRNYECYHCGFDQWLDALEVDMAEVQPDAA